MNRHEMRKNAFILTFEKIFIDEPCDRIIEDAADADVFELTDACTSLFKSVYAHVEPIDAQIAGHLNKWSINRISKISLAILRIAVCEMLYWEEIPVSVAINEAVELAKEFSGEEDASFVNGVLGSIDRERQTAEV